MSALAECLQSCLELLDLQEAGAQLQAEVLWTSVVSGSQHLRSRVYCNGANLEAAHSQLVEREQVPAWSYTEAY